MPGPCWNGWWKVRRIRKRGWGPVFPPNGIEPHIPVFDKGERTDGTFSRSDFTYDHAADHYTCPAGKHLKQFNRNYKTPRSGVTKAGFRNYRARKADCDVCPFKDKCCPGQPHRKLLRSIHEGARTMARDIARRDAYVTSRRERSWRDRGRRPRKPDNGEMLFAHLKRILGLTKLRLKGPNGARDEFHLAATAQNLRKLAKLVPESA